jgi:hypothetical protein
VPADTNLHTLRVYVGGYGVQANFEAYLSDLSAAPYLDSSLSGYFDNFYGVYTLNYAAASAGQTLNVNYHTKDVFDFDFGNVTLQSATLQGAIPAVPLPVRLLNPSVMGNSFVFSFATQTNATYLVQHTSWLSPTNWSTVSSIPGTGSTVTVTNQNGTSAQGFYRVQVQ